MFITSDGVNFEVVEILGDGLGTPDPQTEGGWLFHSFRVLDIPNITLTNQVQMHFVARDDPPGSIVEAGIDDFTYGDLGCTSNPLGTSYCGPAIPNSTGAPGVITADGSPFTLSNRVVLTASQLPADFGYFLNSMTQGSFQPPTSSGFLCLGGAIGRYNQPGLVQPGPSFSIVLDLANTPTPNAFVAIQPGETWNFQAWYRDTGSNNFTDGVTITFQ